MLAPSTGAAVRAGKPPARPPSTGAGPVGAVRPGQAAGAGYVGYSTPETCCTTRMTWQE
ncbi:hypothetical protein GCM10010353_31190 [Streptomyces chryseus]|nr:hypothetical protein GCM10010353_31190 [Streptomyces chryseus]